MEDVEHLREKIQFKTWQIEAAKQKESIALSMMCTILPWQWTDSAEWP